MEIPKQLGRYLVRRKVGEGGMGVVYEGYDPSIARRVALKAIKHEYVEGPDADEFLHRLQREAQAAGGLNHPNVVAVYDYCDELKSDADGVALHAPFIVMEYVEGRELANCFKSHDRFTLSEIQRIMGEILAALGYLHSHGVVHRDIKPSNIILLDDGSVKVADFGIARCESVTLTRVGAVMGSPSYMSPEQYSGQAVDGRCDLYAAGVILYQFLTGALPFTGTPAALMHKALYEQPVAPSTSAPEVPRAFDAIVRRALAKRPGDRFQTASEFTRAIVAVRDDGATRAVARRAPGRRRWRSGLVPSAIVGALMVGLVFMVLPMFSSTRQSVSPAVAGASTNPAVEPTLAMALTEPSASGAPVAPVAPARSFAAEPVVTHSLIAQAQPMTKVASRSLRRNTDGALSHCSDYLQKASLEPLSPKEADDFAKNCR